MRVKILLFLFLLILSQAYLCRAQTLDNDWKRILEVYNNGKYDSVVVLASPFINNLKIINNDLNLTVAYYHMGIALTELQLFAKADSVFALATECAYKISKPEIAREIHTQRISRLFIVAKRLQSTMPESAIVLYSSIVNLADSISSGVIKISACFEKSKALYNQGRSQDGKELLTQTLNSNPELDSINPQLKKALVAQLSRYYIHDFEFDKLGAMPSALSKNELADLNIGVAADYEKMSQFENSLITLNAVRENILNNGTDFTIFEYCKKRLNLYSALGRLGEGIDTLLADINMVKRYRDTSYALLFNLRYTYLLLALKTGRVNESIATLAFIDKDANAKKLQDSLQLKYILLKADIAYFQGAYADAERFYTEVLRKEIAVNEQRLVILNNLGLTYTKLGNYQQSVSTFQELAEKSAMLGNVEFQIYSGMNSAIALIKTNETDKAISVLKKTIKQSQEGNFSNLEIMATLRLAEGYKVGGFTELSANAFASIKAVYMKLENPLFKVPVLQALAEFEKGTGNQEGAMEFLREGFEIAKRAGVISSTYIFALELADILVEMDSVKPALELYKFAESYLEKSFDLDEKVTMNLLLAKAFRLDKKYSSAKEAIRKNLRLLSGTDDISTVFTQQENITDKYLYTLTISSLAEVFFTEGSEGNDLKIITTSYAMAKRAVEILVSDYYLQVSKNKNSSDAWVRSVDSYKLLVGIALDLYRRTSDYKYYEDAFNASEQSRSQAFINDIGSQLLSRMKDPNAKAIDKLSGIEVLQSHEKKNINVDLTQSTIGNQVRGFKITKDTTKTKYKIEETALEEEYTKIIKKMQSNKNKVLNLVTVNYLGLEALKSLLKEDEVVLNYFFTKNVLYLFVISKGLNKIITIERSSDEMSDLVEVYRQEIQNPASTQYMQLSKDLYNILLNPVKSEIDGKRIFIIASGKLHNLPFGSLHDSVNYLTETNVFSVLPNASTLQFIARERKSLVGAKVLAVGNPINNFTPPLPGAENEVRMIQQYYPGATLLVETAASESLIKKIMPSYKIVHFACHGLFNYDYPLFSALAVANDSVDDGKLEVHELYNLNLMNTEMIVLSACETGLAQLKKNDEMIGLVRGFLFSGVPSVVASLWKVDDEGTSLLMSRLYYYLSRGLSKDEALQKAQRELINSPNLRHPFYWAAFVMNGYGE